MLIQDILKFISHYNDKYKEKLNIHRIIQGDNEDINLINKVSNYLLDLLFGIESEDSNNEQKNMENIDENSNESSNKDNNISDEESQINGNESSDSDEEDLSFVKDEFEPKLKKDRKRVKKNNYNDSFGEENSLKMFQNSLLINNNRIKYI